ncbi:hypothetical protein [Thioflexithrix psekupsensis]|uniref:Uncharacterized protein n=1 Tax=Thioflexithrix psekupsensis TaxID=1570016 RepID=A0A251X6Y2_9GAMM|nr:hypothetical protein [Thioflexithrix psekupsensis]OUD13221.1 hypothetical protein TPSD3_11330 [Thioflexithrix psekupsensis]
MYKILYRKALIACYPMFYTTLLMFSLVSSANSLELISYSEDISDIKDCKDINKFDDYLPENMVFISSKKFIPLSCVSKSRREYQSSSIFRFLTDTFQYFKFPLTEVSVFLTEKNTTAKITFISDATTMDNNSVLSKEDVEDWFHVLDKLETNGEQLWKRYGAYGTLEYVQSIGILLYTNIESHKNAILFVNFVYSSTDRDMTGQVLLGLNVRAESKDLIGEHIFYTTGGPIINFIEKNVIGSVKNILPIILELKK